MLPEPALLLFALSDGPSTQADAEKTTITATVKATTRKDSVVFGVAGIFFGLLVGWIIGSQQAAAPRPASAATVASNGAAPAQTAAALDENRAAALRRQAEGSPQDADARVQLGNLYFDAERFTDAVHWYEEAVRINPRDVNASISAVTSPLRFSISLNCSCW